MHPRQFPFTLLVLSAFWLALSADARPAAPPVPGRTADRGHVRATLPQTGALFVENVGQLPTGARFAVPAGGQTLFLADEALWFVLQQPARADLAAPPRHRSRQPLPPAAQRGVALKLSFVGATPHPQLVPFDRRATHVAYLRGNDPSRWQRDVPVWGGVRYTGLYPGIDLEISGAAGRLAPRLIVHAGADVRLVRLRVEGADALALTNDQLTLTTAIGTFALPLLPAVTPAGTALLLPGVGPRVQGTDLLAPIAAQPSLAVVPQPQDASDLLYATFLGGGRDDEGVGIAVDSSGAAYVTGNTDSVDFPTTPGAFDMTYGRNSSSDAFVVKLNPAGSALLYATFLGGGSEDKGAGIAVDSTGAAYVVGTTTSIDFPTTPNAFDTTLGGNSFYDAFVVKLNPAGSALLYATFLRGTDWDQGAGVAVDSSGAAYVTGFTNSIDFPTTPNAFDTSLGGSDAFVVKLNSAGSDLLYATFLGGGSSEGGNGIAVDSTGAAYVTGYTYSADFPATPGAFDTTYGGDLNSGDAFVVKLNPAGSNLLYATFFGGGGSIAVDSTGAAYITGSTGSDFPTTPGAFDVTYGGSYSDAFVAKLNPAGSDLLYATFLGGGSSEGGNGIAVDSTGAAYVTGYTYSADFPTTPGTFDVTFGGNGFYDGFVVKLNPAGSALLYATFLGGESEDAGAGIAVDSTGAAYITGYTYSSDFPTTPRAFDTVCGCQVFGSDAFIVRLAVGQQPTYTIAGLLRDSHGQPLAGARISIGAGQTTTTGSDGAYTFVGLTVGVYTLTPARGGYTFSPAARQLELPPSALEANFTAIAAPVLLPLIRVPIPCDPYEPNNNRDENPFGPIRSGQDIHAGICEKEGNIYPRFEYEDNYFFDTTTSSPVQVTLLLPASLVDHTAIWLYPATDLSTRIADCGTDPVGAISTTWTCGIPSPGRYVVRLYAYRRPDHPNEQPFDNEHEYVLRVTYQ